jgi:hypothetical protein
MKGDTITLNQSQLTRVQVMSLVEAGKITLREAAKKIGRSYRQAIERLKREQELEGCTQNRIFKGAFAPEFSKGFEREAEGPFGAGRSIG